MTPQALIGLALSGPSDFFVRRSNFLLRRLVVLIWLNCISAVFDSFGPVTEIVMQYSPSSRRIE